MRELLIGYNGCVKLAPKQNERTSYYEPVETDKRLIDFCLNCTKKKCNGNCPDFIDFRRNLK